MIDKLLAWLRRKPQTIPDDLWRRTISELPFLSVLSPEEESALRQLADGFLAEKEFTTAGGLHLTDAMCVSIAAQGCLPILRLGLEAYRGWIGIVVYPSEFVVHRRQEDEFGVVHEFDDILSGEAWQGGPLLISWQDVQMAGEGYNVVIHEFAHKLDMLNGDTDGIPVLHSGITTDEWERIMFEAYGDFCRRVDQGEETTIDPYASEHPSEFFAVLSEAFFEVPEVVAADYSELYDLFTRYYRQDPLARLQAPMA